MKPAEAKALRLFKQKYDFRGYSDKEILEAYTLVKADQVSIKRKQEKQAGVKKKKKETFYADSDEEFDDMSEDEIIEVQKTQTKKPQVKKRVLKKNTEFESKLWSDYRALKTEKARKAAREQLANLKRQAAPKPPPPKPKPPPPNVAQKRSAPTKNVPAKKTTPEPQTDSESELDFESSDEDMEDLVFPENVEKALKNVELQNLTAAQVKKLAPYGSILDKLSPEQLQELLESNNTTHGDDRPILVTGPRRMPKGTKPRKRSVLLPNGKYIQI